MKRNEEMTTKTAPKATTTSPEPTKPLSRKETLAYLESKGYAGPTSFTASTLREVVAWMEAGSPKDAGVVPTGILYAVHPDLKPTPSAKTTPLTKFQQGYQNALAEVAELGDDLASIKQWISDNSIEAKA